VLSQFATKGNMDGGSAFTSLVAKSNKPVANSTGPHERSMVVKMVLAWIIHVVLKWPALCFLRTS